MSNKIDLQSYWGPHWQSAKHQSIDLEEYLSNFKFQILNQTLKTLSKGARVLEIGSGNCQWLRICRAHYPELQFFASDLVGECVSIAKFYDFHAIQSDTRHLSIKDDSFDLVFSWGVVEHFPETELAVSEHFRILKPGGTLIIDVPNKLSLAYIHEELSHIKYGRRDRQKIMAEYGNRFFPFVFYSILKQNKPHIIQRYGSGPVIPIYGKMLSRLDRFVPGFLRKRFGGNLGYVVRK